MLGETGESDPLHDIRSVGFPAAASDEELSRHARRVLSDNWAGSFTVPSRRLYPHQWSWDSAFIGLGLAHTDPVRAWRELRTLFEAQWRDGRLPAIVFNPAVPAGAYFPGPEVWQSHRAAGAPDADTSGIVQPPVHALIAREIYHRVPDRESRAALIALYPALTAQHTYLARERDLGGEGLLAIVHPWESGLDNSPAWDDPLAAVPADPMVMSKYQRRDLKHVAEQDRPTDTDYARYLSLLESYRDGGPDQQAPYNDTGLVDRHPFLVECPLFNALYIASDQALADIARLAGADPRPHRQRAITNRTALVRHLFNAEAGGFFARDLHTGKLSTAHTIAGLAPLILPDLPPPIVNTLIATATSPRFGLGHATHLILPTHDRTAPTFDPRRYWRGPAWFNTNWLIWRGLTTHRHHHLADHLRQATLDLARHTGLYEYYDTTTGAGCGTPNFSWTAAITLDLLLANPPSPQPPHQPNSTVRYGEARRTPGTPPRRTNPHRRQP